MIAKSNNMKVKRNYLKFVLYGILVVGIQEFWVSYVWRNDIKSFLMAVIILEVLFLTFAFHFGKLIDKLFTKLRIADLIAYLIFGLVGLIVIEWFFAGNWPGSGRNQFVMFSTWGGAALIARLFTDNSYDLKNVKKYFLKFYIPFAAIVTVLALIFPSTLTFSPEKVSASFAITYLAANWGYPLMNIFYIWFIIKKIKNKNILEQS